MSVQILTQMGYKEIPKNSDTLSIWLFIAAVFHAIVLMGVSFDSPKPQVISKAIEVTIVNSASKKAPENAKYFAQNNQIAAGLVEQKPLPIAKKKPQSGQHQRKQKPLRSSRTQTVIEHRLITQKNAPKKLNSAQKQEKPQEKSENAQSQPELSMEELDKQIALLEVKLQQQKEHSEKTRIKSISAISAHKQVAAQYIKDWERKVERNGNLNYPEINGKQDFSGILQMDVGVNSDGSIYNIVIVKSSGMQKLDDAAKKIVEMSAPFAPLPESITQELDVLRIRREWIFSDDGTVSSSISTSE
jgi:periplasmic protein TonB